jgi:hypothetical protein
MPDDAADHMKDVVNADRQPNASQQRDEAAEAGDAQRVDRGQGDAGP